MAVSSKYIPDDLTQYFEMLKTIDEGEDLLARLLENSTDGSLKEEIEFMKRSLADRNQELSDKECAAWILLKSIEDDLRAYVCAALHYICGYSWQEVQEITNWGKSEEAVKGCVYRALRKAYQPGKSEKG